MCTKYMATFVIDQSNNVLGCGKNIWDKNNSSCLINGLSKIEGLPTNSIQSVTSGSHVYFLDFDKNASHLENTSSQIICRNIRQISSNNLHSIFLDTNFDVLVYGYNGNNQLGSNKNTIRSPEILKGLPKIEAVSTGKFHTLFIDFNNVVWGCGSNHSNQLGLHHNSNQSLPIQLFHEFSGKIQAIYAGTYHSIFLDFDNNSWICGDHFEKHNYIKHPNVPQKINCLPENSVEYVSTSTHSLFLDFDGNVWSSGSNNYGQLGFVSEKFVNDPVKLDYLPKIQQVKSYEEHSVLLDIDGYIWTCGRNNYCQLGSNYSPCIKKFTQIEDIPIIKSLADYSLENTLPLYKTKSARKN